MKKQLTSFLAGTLVTTLIFALSISALASVGAFDITVSPIDLLVHGNVFQPKDVNGKDVMVFVYEGTTYAPVRALAEAYGLQVGYDSGKNLATVSQPEVDNTAGAYTEWQNAQNAPKSGDMYRDMVKAKEQIEEGFNTGRTNTPEVQAAIKFLIPESELKDIPKYIAEVISRYFTNDNIGITNFLNDAVEKGLMTQDGTDFTIAPDIDFDDFLREFPLNADQLKAMFNNLMEFPNDFKWTEDAVLPEFSTMTYEEFKDCFTIRSEYGEKLSEPFTETIRYYGEDVPIAAPAYTFNLYINFDDKYVSIDEMRARFEQNENCKGYLDQLAQEFTQSAPHNSIMVYLFYRGEPLSSSYLPNIH